MAHFVVPSSPNKVADTRAWGRTRETRRGPRIDSATPAPSAGRASRGPARSARRKAASAGVAPEQGSEVAGRGGQRIDDAFAPPVSGPVRDPSPPLRSATASRFWRRRKRAGGEVGEGAGRRVGAVEVEHHHAVLVRKRAVEEPARAVGRLRRSPVLEDVEEFVVLRRFENRGQAQLLPPSSNSTTPGLSKSFT